MLFRFRSQLELDQGSGMRDVPFSDIYASNWSTGLTRWCGHFEDLAGHICNRPGLGVKCYVLLEISVDSADRPSDLLPLFGDDQVDGGILEIADERAIPCGVVTDSTSKL
jgi:hypothetical protein